MFQNDFRNGIIINFPQVEKHREIGIYFYCILNCSWEEKEKTIKTSLAEHRCQLREYYVDKIIKDETQKPDRQETENNPEAQK